MLPYFLWEDVFSLTFHFFPLSPAVRIRIAGTLRFEHSRLEKSKCSNRNALGVEGRRMRGFRQRSDGVGR